MKNLVIVESPAKCKTIEKILGASWKVVACFGHVSDLPKDSLGLELGTFRPQYVLTDSGKKTIARLRPLVDKAETIWIATDLDREGEAIAWHLKNILGLKEYKRIVFNEITKSAIESSIKSPRLLNMNIVNAQQARRFLDRIIGFLVSPVLTECAGYFLSAGRVQSPAVHLVYLREKEIEKFEETKHYGVRIHLSAEKDQWSAVWDSSSIVNENNPFVLDQSIAESVALVARVTVKNIKDTNTNRNPLPPFTTSTMQQDASTTLKLSTSKTMSLAQTLYEQGLITYMRTDVPNLSDEAIENLRMFLAESGYERDIPEKPNRWAVKEDAQQAHEAIRPTDFSNKEPHGVEGDSLRLYSLIRNRAIASQMKPSVYTNRTIQLESSESVSSLGNTAIFLAKSRSLIYRGWEAIYSKKLDEDENGDVQHSLPKLETGSGLSVKSGEVLTHKTKPPGRYTEASLLKKLEKEGIGRPSTYASIFTTIQKRGFVRLERRTFRLLHNGDVVVSALKAHFEFVGIEYSRNLESKLDSIAEGKLNFKDLLKEVLGYIQVEISELKSSGLVIDSEFQCGDCGRSLVPINGKSGLFWSCSGYNDGLCKKTYVDDNGVPYIPPKEPEHLCSKCDSPLVRKKQKSGWVWVCSRTNNLECNEQMGDKKGIPVTIKRYYCPKCECELTRRKNKGKKGFWWGCSGFRKNACRFTASDKRGKPELRKDVA